MLIDLKALGGVEMREDPFEWAYLPKIFRSDEIAKRLADAFPNEGYAHYTRHSTAKNYDTRGRFLIKMGHGELHEPDTLPEIWRQFGRELLTDAYIEAVSKATGQSLADTHLEAVFWRLPQGSTIDPHTDSPLKKVTHLFYFNDVWPLGSAGCLRILRSFRIDDVVAEFPPLVNSSVIFNRSGKSWHGYLPVEGDWVRKAIQISFCTCAATK